MLDDKYELTIEGIQGGKNRKKYKKDIEKTREIQRSRDAVLDNCIKDAS